MSDGEDEPETPEAFLKNLGNRLKTSAGVDGELAAILAAHILQGAPADNAVTLAKNAIVRLAEKRAKSPRAEAGHG
jgi:hypothetical protein